MPAFLAGILYLWISLKINNYLASKTFKLLVSLF